MLRLEPGRGMHPYLHRRSMSMERQAGGRLPVPKVRPLIVDGRGLLMEDGKALVLGGGGIAGIAWLTGLFTGFAEFGLDLVGADLIVGTSAGACVAAQITSGLDLDVLFAQQVNPDQQVSEPLPDAALVAEAASMRPYLLEAGDADATRRRRGAFALGVKTIPEAVRR